MVNKSTKRTVKINPDSKKNTSLERAKNMVSGGVYIFIIKIKI